MGEDFTRGSPSRSIRRFVVPLLVMSLIQQLYNTVDLIFIGRYLGDGSFASVGISTLLITCIIGFLNGIAVAANIIVSRAIGAKRYSDVRGMIKLSRWISVIGGVLMMGLGMIITPLYLHWVQAPMALVQEARLYISVYLCATTFILYFNTSSGIIKAFGNSKAPLKAQTIGSLVNIVLNFICVVVFRGGVVGIAIATVIGQAVAALLMHRQLQLVDTKYTYYVSDVGMWKEVLKIGLSAGLQSTLITFSNIIVQSRVNQLDQSYITAFFAYYKIEMLIYLPIVAFGQGVLVFVGQNLGANATTRIRTYLPKMTIMFSGFVILGSIVMIAGAPMLFSIFTKDSNIVDIGVRLVSITFPFYFIYVFLQVFSDVLRGYGKVNISTTMILIGMCIVRPIGVELLFRKYHSAYGIIAVFPITWLVCAVMLGVAVYFVMRTGLKEKRELYVAK